MEKVIKVIQKHHHHQILKKQIHQQELIQDQNLNQSQHKINHQEQNPQKQNLNHLQRRLIKSVEMGNLSLKNKIVIILSHHLLLMIQ